MNTQKQYTKEKDLLKSLNTNYNKHNIFKLMKMLNNDLSYGRKGSISHTYKFIKALRSFSLDSEHGGRGIDGTPFSQHVYSKNELLNDLPKRIKDDKKEIKKHFVFNSMQKDLKDDLIDVENKYNNKLDDGTLELFDDRILKAIYNNGYDDNLLNHYKDDLESSERTLNVIKKLNINYFSYERQTKNNNEKVSYKRFLGSMSENKAKKTADNYNFMAKYNINFYPATFESARKPFNDWYTFYKINNF